MTSFLKFFRVSLYPTRQSLNSSAQQKIPTHIAKCIPSPPNSPSWTLTLKWHSTSCHHTNMLHPLHHMPLWGSLSLEYPFVPLLPGKLVFNTRFSLSHFCEILSPALQPYVLHIISSASLCCSQSRAIKATISILVLWGTPVPSTTTGIIDIQYLYWLNFKSETKIQTQQCFPHLSFNK